MDRMLPAAGGGRRPPRPPWSLLAACFLFLVSGVLLQATNLKFAPFSRRCFAGGKHIQV